MSLFFFINVSPYTVCQSIFIGWRTHATRAVLVDKLYKQHFYVCCPYFSLLMSLNEDVPLLISSSKNEENRERRFSPLSTDLTPWLKCRVVIAAMAFLGFCNVYALRVNLSLAIVVMANNTDSNIPVNVNGTTHNRAKVITKKNITIFY